MASPTVLSSMTNEVLTPLDTFATKQRRNEMIESKNGTTSRKGSHAPYSPIAYTFSYPGPEAPKRNKQASIGVACEEGALV